MKVGGAATDHREPRPADRHRGPRRPRNAWRLYFIGALCAGALVAIAMAHRLRDAGETVLPLLLLDRLIPSVCTGRLPGY